MKNSADTAAAPPAAISEEEQKLWAACQSGDGKAREELFALYLPLARRISWRFKRDEGVTRLEPAELLQFASLGLLEAMDRYKPELGVPFRYYCTRRIAGAILEGIGRLSEVSHQIAIRRRIERERVRALRAEEGEPRTLDEKLALIGDIAAELAIGIMLEDSVMYRDGDRDPAKNAYETLAWKQAVQLVVEAVDGLPERGQSVVRLHYLEGLPFEQIARLMGVTKGRISQLHKQAIILLRKRLSAMGKFRVEG